jgi:hypothetical protein
MGAVRMTRFFLFAVILSALFPSLSLAYPQPTEQTSYYNANTVDLITNKQLSIIYIPYGQYPYSATPGTLTQSSVTSSYSATYSQQTVDKITVYQAREWDNNVYLGDYSTGEEACQVSVTSFLANATYQYSDPTCYAWNSVSSLGSRTIYTSQTCPSGYTVSGSQCVGMAYTCNAGDTLSGTTCYHTYCSDPSYTLDASSHQCTKPAWFCNGTPSETETCYNNCPDGYIDTGSQCGTTAYTCPDGYTELNQDQCHKPGYSCPEPDILEGTQCKHVELACPNNLILTDNNACACPSGYIYADATQTCYPSDTSTTTTGSTTGSTTDGSTTTGSTTGSTTDGSTTTGSTTGSTTDGSTTTGSTTGSTTDGSTTTSGSNGGTTGSTGGGTGSTTSTSSTSSGETTCPPGSHYNSALQQCVSDSNGTECLDGYHWDWNAKACVGDGSSSTTTTTSGSTTGSTTGTTTDGSTTTGSTTGDTGTDPNTGILESIKGFISNIYDTLTGRGTDPTSGTIAPGLSEMDGFISDIQNPGHDSSEVDVSVSALGGAPGCSPMILNLPFGDYDLDICSKLQPLRDVLGWFLYMMTAYFLVELATNRPGG